MGGTAGNIVVEPDGEASIVALRNALARYHGGAVAPRFPLRGRARPMGLLRITAVGCAT